MSLKIPLPVVLVRGLLTPLCRLVLDQRQPTHSVEPLWNRRTQFREPSAGCLVPQLLRLQSVRLKTIPVIAPTSILHTPDVCQSTHARRMRTRCTMYKTSVESNSPRCLSLSKHSLNAFIHGFQRFGAMFTVIRNVECILIREVDALPGITLVLHPRRPVLQHFAFGGHRRRIGEQGVFVHVLMSLRRLEGTALCEGTGSRAAL